MKLLDYNDKHLGGKGFVEWQEFEHPQFGKVEIGGWTHMYTFRNPPPVSMATTEEAKRFIFDTIHNNCVFTLKHALCTPLLAIQNATTEQVADNLYKVSAVIANRGFLPTHLTERALKHETAGSVTVSISGENIELVMGQTETDIGHLAGRDERTATWSPWLQDWSATKRKVEWLVRASVGGATLEIVTESPKAGIKSQQVTLS
jgi:hypothetical protein